MSKNSISIYKRRWFVIFAAIIFIPVVIFIGVYIDHLIFMRSIDKTLKGSQEQIDRTEQVLLETKEYIATQKELFMPKLELQDWNSKKEYGYVIVEGVVKNISEKTIRNVEVLVEFYTEDGRFISSASSLIEYQNLLPNQTSSFKVTDDENPLIKKSKISFKKLLGDKIFHEEKRE
jgi:hypothetical protein